MSDQLFPTGDPAPGGHTSVPRAEGPLPARLRPVTLDEVVGQEHLLGTPEEPTALRRAIAEGRPHSMILYGPPGSGKTTLARVAAATASAAFEELSAVEAGRAEVRAVLERAEHRRQSSGTATTFFLDEIHRFNKAQQDALLPAVEEGLVTLIGATTENPYFEVNSALHLADADLRAARAGHRRRRDPAPPRPGPGRERGDRRRRGDRVPRRPLRRRRAHRAGRAGDRAGLRRPRDDRGRRGGAAAPRAALRQGRRPALRLHLRVDQGDARIRPRRGALLPRGHARGRRGPAVPRAADGDPRLRGHRRRGPHGARPSRRTPRTRSSTSGCPSASSRCRSARSTSRWPRSPTRRPGRSPPARDHVRRYGAQPPPAYLRDAHYGGAAALGRGQGYEYPHDKPEGLSSQDVMPEEVGDVRFYDPRDREPALRARLDEVRRARGRD